MPNHCDNKLTVTGPKAEVDRFILKARGEKECLDVNKFVPMPEELRNQPSYPGNQSEQTKRLQEAHGYPDWYEWACGEWGTKWGAYEGSMERDWPDSVTYGFSTAWAPLGNKLIAAISDQFPTLHLELNYEEPGNGFRGSTAAQGGRIVKNHCEEFIFEEDGE